MLQHVESVAWLFRGRRRCAKPWTCSTQRWSVFHLIRHTWKDIRRVTRTAGARTDGCADDAYGEMSTLSETPVEVIDLSDALPDGGID